MTATSVRRGAASALLIALLLTLLVAVQPADARTRMGALPTDELRLFNHLNHERAIRGLPRLTMNMQMLRLAREHSDWMAAHSDSGGGCGGSTLRHRKPLSSGVTERWSTLRENVGCNAPANTDRLHTSLMNSAGHRANILATNVNQVGIGVSRDNKGQLWATQIFMGGGHVANMDAVNEGVRASRTQFASSRPDFVVLSRSDVFADSLGGSALAGGRGAILFTDAPTSAEREPMVRPETREEINRLLGGRGRVYLLGGTAAISARSEHQLKLAGYDVRRLAGGERMATAAAIAREVVKRHGAPSRILIASGENWPDAITGGAAAARKRIPLVLTSKSSYPAATRAFLDSYPKASRIVLGGPAAVNDNVVRAMRAGRVSGPDRHATALAIADKLFVARGGRIVFAHGWSGTAWGRALAWSSYSASTASPQVLVGDSVPSSVRSWLKRQGSYKPVFVSGLRSAVKAELG